MELNEPETASVAEVKQTLARQCSLMMGEFDLLHWGVVLEDAATLYGSKVT